MGLKPEDLTNEERQRTLAAAEFIHDAECPSRCREKYRASCRFFRYQANTRTTAALRHLDESPRDAHGARLILHDTACMSGCSGEERDDHAKRTQTGTVRALRKFHKEESCVDDLTASSGAV